MYNTVSDQVTGCFNYHVRSLGCRVIIKLDNVEMKPRKKATVALLALFSSTLGKLNDTEMVSGLRGN